MSIDDSFRLNKIARYNPDLIPDSIYVASVKSDSTLTTNYEPPQDILITYDYPNTDHIIMRDKPGYATEKIEYYYRHHNGMKC